MLPTYRFILGVILASVLYSFNLLYPSFISAQSSNGIIITEFMPHPDQGGKEWVELYNGGTDTVDLEGWFIDDREESPSVTPIRISGLVDTPSDLILSTGSYLAFDLSKNIFNNGVADCARLLGPDQLKIDMYCYEGTTPGESYARERVGETYTDVWYQTSSPTRGSPNPETTTSPTPTITPTSSLTPTKEETPIPTNIIITEFMPHPTEGGEWAELYNDNPFPVDLEGWKIDDQEAASAPRPVSPTLLPMYGFIQISWGGSILNDFGDDQVRLLNPRGEVVDEFSYSDSQVGVFYARDGESYTSLWFQTTTSTPGSSNQITSPNEGQEDGNQEVEEEAESGQDSTASESPSLTPTSNLPSPTSNILGRQTRPQDQKSQTTVDVDKDLFTPPQLSALSAKGQSSSSAVTSTFPEVNESTPSSRGRNYWILSGISIAGVVLVAGVFLARKRFSTYP